jgi:hypothetical protein
MDETRGPVKPDSERKIQHVFFHLQNLDLEKKWDWEKVEVNLFLEIAERVRCREHRLLNSR